MTEERDNIVDEHLTYYECPYVGCNWWVALERGRSMMQARTALVEHCREVHAGHVCGCGQEMDEHGCPFGH